MADIEIANADGTAVITLNRPQRRNAMTLAMWRELGRLMGELGADTATRAIILTGAGGNFCAGADISEFGAVRSDAERGRIYGKAVDDCGAAIMEAPKPVIAAVSGYCFGGGCGLAMACDFRVANESAVFSITAAKLSIVYGIRDTQNLMALVGPSQAKRILFAAPRLGAEEARRIGLADEIAADALTAARALAQTMVASAPLTVAGSKLILRGLATGSLDRKEAHAAMSRAMDSADYQEGQRAFAEKRAPRFKGS
jgi:enoyl-CoA hydratase/carnithine racemase